jgi:small subunit ribosomal protein S8
LQDAQYVGSFEEIPDGKGQILKINLLGCINNTCVIKPRFAIKKDQYDRFEKRYLPSEGFGIIILSTNKGLMTHTEAKKQKLGGKLVCYCY